VLRSVHIMDLGWPVRVEDRGNALPDRWLLVCGWRCTAGPGKGFPAGRPGGGNAAPVVSSFMSTRLPDDALILPCSDRMPRARGRGCHPARGSERSRSVPPGWLRRQRVGQVRRSGLLGRRYRRRDRRWSRSQRARRVGSRRGRTRWPPAARRLRGRGLRRTGRWRRGRAHGSGPRG
jgi:hypothetical protein